jgi:hypothetical protein
MDSIIYKSNGHTAHDVFYVMDEIISIGNEKSSELAYDSDGLLEFADAAEGFRFLITVDEAIKAREAIEAAVSFVDFHVAFHRMNAGFSAATDTIPSQESGYNYCFPVLEAIQSDLFVFASMHDRQTECEEQERVKAESEAKDLEAIQAVLDDFMASVQTVGKYTMRRR